MELGFFKWFGYVSLCPQDVANGLHLYYILFVLIFWMITMCCEVSYLYIGLLTQLSYLTYVGFLNITVNRSRGTPEEIRRRFLLSLSTLYTHSVRKTL
jgi:hypothetical protein